MAGVDLHIHSTASDGSLTPADIVSRAAELGLTCISITDHDTVAGVSPAIGAGEAAGIRVIPGVELSAGLDGRGIHILGYLIDHDDPELIGHLKRLRGQRLTRAEAIVESLRDADMDVALHDVLDAADGGAVGRAHIARVLVAGGHAESVSDAFGRLLGSGRPHYVPKPLAHAGEVIGWITAAGGVAVVAHPSLSRIDDLIPDLVDLGIVGIEAYHARHDRKLRDHYAGVAARHGLVATGGSDFHGDDVEGDPLGSADVPPGVVDDLVRAKRRASGREATPYRRMRFAPLGVR
jgi:predicted metal-dependent phosphoesterase TrpH